MNLAERRRHGRDAAAAAALAVTFLYAACFVLLATPGAGLRN